MASGRARLAIAAADWPRYLARFPAGGIPTLLEGLAKAGDGPRRRTPEAVPAAAGLRTRLEAAPAVKRDDMLRDAVRREAARVMALPAGDAIDDERPLRDLGLDSLMSVELRNALVSACGSKLPATLLFDHPTVAALARELGRAAFADLFAARPAAGADLDALDVRELSALLEAELREADAGGLA
jgi:acyl carrier protein